MSDQPVLHAYAAIHQATDMLEAAEAHPDPVWQRRHRARAAARLRIAADHLDDKGRLDPDWDA